MPRTQDDFRTAGKEWRRRRNLVIAAAWSRGISIRHLADVFDLPRSTVTDILAALRRETPFERDRPIPLRHSRDRRRRNRPPGSAEE